MKYEEERHRRENGAAIIEEVKDLRVGYKSILPLKGPIDFGDGKFYDFRADIAKKYRKNTK